MASTLDRRDLIASALLAILAVGLYVYRADQRAQNVNERPLTAAIDLLKARGGHDQAGRFLPLFVRVSSDLWLPPVPAYATLAVATVGRGEQPARLAAALFGALGIGLTYLFATELFRQRALAWTTALLLLANPSYAASARSGAADGVWIVPPLVVSLIALARFVQTRSPRALAIAAAALASCAYAQPSGALLVVIVTIAVAIALGRAELLNGRDALRAAGAAAVVALPMALWFALHPASYFDTLGRWFLHPAYIRNPWSLVVRLTNWFSLAEWASIYWNFFDPTDLLYSATAPASAGIFPMTCGVLLVAAAYELARPKAPRPPYETALFSVVAIVFVASPLVPASFAEPGAIQKAISLTVAGTILCAIGVRAMWTRARWGRAVVALLLGLAIVQFAAFYG